MSMLASIARQYADAIEYATGVRPVAEDPDDPFQMHVGPTDDCDECRCRSDGQTVTAMIYDPNADDLRPLCWECVRDLRLL